MDTNTRLHPLSIILHWAVALPVIVLALVGLYMAENEVWSLYPWHKAIGVIVLPLALMRTLWRLKCGWPPAVAPVNRLMQRLTKIAHASLLALTLLMPITGMMHSGLGGHGITVFGWVMVPSHQDPAHPGKALPYNATLAHWGEELHEMLGNALLLLVALHVAAALKHHLIDKDATLRRMQGRAS